MEWFMKIKTILIFIGFLSVAGCSSTRAPQEQPQLKLTSLLNHSLFKTQETVSKDELFKLPEAEKSKFLAFVAKQQASKMRMDIIVYNYLENKLSDFSYHGDTLTSMQALDHGHGNCISLAVLTQSYAALLDLETSFQEVTSQPVFAKEDNLVYVAKHFRTKVYAPEENDTKKDPNKILFIKPGSLIDYFPTRGSMYSGSADINDLISKFYSNLAADALAVKDYDLAYSNILQANKYTPTDPELFNLAAVLHRRTGDSQSAKKIYKAAINQQLISINLLTNYQFLAKKMGDKKLEEQLDAKLFFKEKDPYELLTLAKNDLQTGRLYKAKRHIVQAITKAPYIAELYLELAKIRHQQGHYQQTKALLKKAMELEKDTQKLNVYQAKLLSMKTRK